MLTNRAHLELPGVKSLQRGFRLLPASAYPDESHGQHLVGHPSGAALPTAVTAAAHFPGVDLTDGHVPATNLDAAGPAAAGQTRARPIRTAPPGTEHPSSTESDHSSTPWWEKSQTHPGPTRTPPPRVS